MVKLKFKTFLNKKNKTGEFPVYLAISHKGNERLIGTKIFIPEESCLVDNHIQGLDEIEKLNARLDYIMDICKERISNICLRGFSCNQVKDYLQLMLEKMSVPKNINTLGETFDYYINILMEQKRISTANIYSASKKKILEKMGDKPLRKIKQMDIKKLLGEWKKEGLSDGNISIHLKNLKRLLNFAVEEGFVFYDIFPMQDIHIPKPVTVFRDLTEEDFIRIKNSPIAKYELRFVRDMFVLAFYLGGMQINDLQSIDFKEKQIRYVSSRNAGIKKYFKEITLVVPPEAESILKKYVLNGKIVWPPKSKKVGVDNFLRYRLKKLSSEFGLETNLTFNTPAKTFGQFGCMVGIPEDVIRHCTGLNVDVHSPVYNYVRVINSHVDTAVRKVIDYINEYEMNLDSDTLKQLRIAL